MPESPRSKAGMYIFIVVGIIVVAGAGYYGFKGMLAPHAAPATTTSAK
jgi:hypothetical protein